MELIKKLSVKFAFVFSLIFILMADISALSMDDILKEDFTNQQRIMIDFEVRKRLYSFEAGKFKLEKIDRNRKKIDSITGKILPWALMEGLSPLEVSRIIVYMFWADDAGASFLDAEDLIPLVALKDIPLEDFVLMVQYIRETKKAGISKDLREALIGKAFYKNWDGLSILGAGRGLMIAHRYGFNTNKAASFLINNIPSKSRNVSSHRLVKIITSMIDKPLDRSISNKLVKNFRQIHSIVADGSSSPAELRKINRISKKVDYLISRIYREGKRKKPDSNKRIDREDEILPPPHWDDKDKPVKRDWRTLSKRSLTRAIKPWLGVPYRLGGKTSKRGIDCSGFTRIVLRDKIIGVPSNKIGVGTVNQKNNGYAVSFSQLRAGDLIFFSASPNRKKITHVGLITPDGKFAHASSSRGVTYAKVKKNYWKSRYVRGRRLFKKVVD